MGRCGEYVHSECEGKCRVSGEGVINQKSLVLRSTVERFDRPPRPVPDRIHTICKYHSIKHNRVVLGAGCRVERL